MSYSIQDALRDAEEGQRFYLAICERYPDAHIETLPDGRKAWVSARIEPTDAHLIATRGFIDPKTHAIDSDGVVWLCGSTEVEGKHVFTDRDRWVHGINFQHDMRQKRPELHAALLKIVQKDRT